MSGRRQRLCPEACETSLVNLWLAIRLDFRRCAEISFLDTMIILWYMEIFGFRLIVRLTNSNYGLTSFRVIRRGLLKRSQDAGCNDDPLSIVTSPWTRSAVGKWELGNFRVSPFYGRYDNSASLKNTLSGNLPRFSKEDIRAKELECGTRVQRSCTLCKSDLNPLIREGLRQTYGCVRYQSTKFQVYPKNFKFYSSRMLYYIFSIKSSWCSVQRLLPENISIPHCQSETFSSQENPEE